MSSYIREFIFFLCHRPLKHGLVPLKGGYVSHAEIPIRSTHYGPFFAWFLGVCSSQPLDYTAEMPLGTDPTETQGFDFGGPNVAPPQIAKFSVLGSQMAKFWVVDFSSPIVWISLCSADVTGILRNMVITEMTIRWTRTEFERCKMQEKFNFQKSIKFLRVRICSIGPVVKLLDFSPRPLIISSETLCQTKGHGTENRKESAHSTFVTI